MTANPFKPSFGVSPPVLAGRDGLIEEFVEGLEDGPARLPGRRSTRALAGLERR